MSLLHKIIYRKCLKQAPFAIFKRNVTGYALRYCEHGDPEKVLEFAEFDVTNKLDGKKVFIKMIAAPVNPADINMVQGKYALKPELPAIGGNEGFGEVIEVSDAVTGLKVGDRVIPANAGWGTWRTHAVSDEDNFIRIDKTIPILNAATISVNPCTAYRMLHDFVDLKPGDTVIQNGANSGVGQAVIQIGKHMNINTINVIRDRPNIEDLKNQLMSLGATHVVIESELRSPCMKEIFKKIPKAKLAFNCVGGKSAAELTRHLAHGSTMVTYGGMSMQPLTLSTASLIFNDIRYRGFWMTRWSNDNSNENRSVLLNEITSIIKAGNLKPPPCRQIHIKNYKDAISKAMEPFISQKQVLIME